MARYVLHHMICPALSIKAIAKIIPRNAMWANVRPPILAIFLLDTTIPPISKTAKRRPTTARETPFVVLNGEISTLASAKGEDSLEAKAVAGIGLIVGESVGSNVGTIVGFVVARARGEAIVCAFATGTAGTVSAYLVPKNWTIIVVFAPARFPSTTPIPISL